MKNYMNNNHQNISKNFQTLSDQRKKLVNKYHLAIDDIDFAEEMLLKRNYFDLINGIEETFPNGNKKPKNFSGFAFEDFVCLYDLNVDFRTYALRVIADFEIQLKSISSYYFNEYVQSNYPKAPVTAYLDKNFYHQPSADSNLFPEPFHEHFEEFIFFHSRREVPSKYKRFVDANDSETATVYKNIYMAKKMAEVPLLRPYKTPPLWVVIKLLDFGQLTHFIAYLIPNVQKKVKKAMGFEDFSTMEFIQALQIVQEFRNHLAHFNMINKFESTISISNDLQTKLGGDIISVYSILGILKKTVDLEPIWNVFSKLNTLISEDDSNKLSPVFDELLTNMGAKDIDSWQVLIKNN